MSEDKKKPFFTVDYSQVEDPEEVEKRQEECEHKTLSILDVSPEVLHNKYGIAFKKDVIHFLCEDCGKMLWKPKK